jgi:hypothetical protein
VRPLALARNGASHPGLEASDFVNRLVGKSAAAFAENDD